LILRSFFLVLLATTSLAGQTNRPPIALSIDLADAPRKILHARLSIPVQPGPLTLVYPQWIPGEHGPTGPIDNLAGIVFTANGQPLAWRRDDVDMFAFHLDVPSGVNTVEAKTDFLATAPPSGFSAGASTSANLTIISWNQVLLCPADVDASQVTVEPSVKLPDGWKFATALAETSKTGDMVHFEAVPLNKLVDSPVLAGKFFKEIPLAPEITPKHFLDIAADGPEDLKITDEGQASFSNLVRETGALFKSRHYGSYHFLLTLSDSVAHFGLEHHQSSDDRAEARMFLDDDLRLLNGDLLPHEFTHSWNGKYRRPAGLTTPNYQKPMKGELLWVYEGLTQYLGDILAVRSGIWTADQYHSYLAASAAELDHRPGRTWRNLQDTAISAQILYGTNEQWDNWRRSVDYYPEGELIWLDVDTTIRRLSKNEKSLNDFCAHFFGLGGNTAPKVVPYTFEDVVNNLNAIQPYDWAAFLRERLTTKASHAPLGGIVNGGYRLEYTEQPNEFVRASESRDRGVNAWYSLGFRVADGAVTDVLMGSPAYNAGLGPSMRLVAINGRRATDELLRDAIREAKGRHEPVELIVENAGFFQVLKINCQDGEKYPHLVREPKTAALLDDILKPLASHPTRTAQNERVDSASHAPE
jgi:predicted metalloprotease with PDZ domain